MTAIDNVLVFCPECSSKMHKMGRVWSGRRQVQRYRCPKCGRTYAPASVDDKKEIDNATH